MAAISFPSNPTVNQVYAQTNGFLYSWNGTAWIGVSTGGAGLYGTWHNVTSSRASGEIYTNTYGYPIAVSASGTPANSGPAIRAYVDGILVSYFNWQFNGAGARSGAFIIVPPGSSYQLFFDGPYGPTGILNWAELY